MTAAQLDNPVIENPYVAPATTAELTDRATTSTTGKVLTVAIGLAGAFMLFIGWAASVMTVIDLHCRPAPILMTVGTISGVGFQPAIAVNASWKLTPHLTPTEIVPTILSEITSVTLSTTTLWLIYGLTVAVTTLGAIMFCSREIPVALMGAFIMCPILLIAYLAGHHCVSPSNARHQRRRSI